MWFLQYPRVLRSKLDKFSLRSSLGLFQIHNFSQVNKREGPNKGPRGWDKFQYISRQGVDIHRAPKSNRQIGRQVRYIFVLHFYSMWYRCSSWVFCKYQKEFRDLLLSRLKGIIEITREDHPQVNRSRDLVDFFWNKRALLQSVN